ncbi:hypothetical protein G293_05025 [Candidatus Liberibacter africanus PTSAPSY]|uniref:Uncharacterized protein n=1 Tax=Candidatus Liberibacter africanus PTSAPSY TaxID=1277257 RepID=A0A0G3I7U0_LIBAF|nr:hypothetical protein G293_05025 [Candidatus Liberibacter africanus PTSAPSY]
MVLWLKIINNLINKIWSLSIVPLIPTEFIRNHTKISSILCNNYRHSIKRVFVCFVFVIFMILLYEFIPNFDLFCLH